MGKHCLLPDTDASTLNFTLLCSKGRVWYALVTFLYVDILGESLKHTNLSLYLTELILDTTGYAMHH